MRDIDKLEYVWREIIGFVRDLEILSHKEHLEEMKMSLSRMTRQICGLILCEGLLYERLTDFTFVSTSISKSGVVF